MIKSRSLFNHQNTIELDTLHDRFSGVAIDPWSEKLKEKGEKVYEGRGQGRKVYWGQLPGVGEWRQDREVCLLLTSRYIYV